MALVDISNLRLKHSLVNSNQNSVLNPVKSRFTLIQKGQILKLLDDLVPSIDIQASYDISRKTVSNIKRKRTEILDALDKNQGNTSSKMVSRKLKFPQVEEAILNFLNDAREGRFLFSGVFVRHMASLFAGQFGVENFTASCGWLEKFCGRNSFCFKKTFGECLSVDPAVVSTWFSKLPRILGTWQLRDIFNADETGLFFRRLPRQGLMRTTEEPNSVKIVKDRVSVLLACSALGEKLVPLIIGTAKNPRAFGQHGIKVVTPEKHGFHYFHNRAAWMSSAIFGEWLDMVNDEMKRQSRSILLLLDNFSGHNVSSRSNIELCFLSPNATSVIQPLDAGIIKSFKDKFNAQLYTDMARKVNENFNAEEYAKSLTVYNASHWTVKAFENVSQQTIVNCFRKCRISEGDAMALDPEPDTLPGPTCDLVRFDDDL